MEIANKSPRRKRKYWTEMETKLLENSVYKYGKKWALIEKNVPIFKQNGRTQVDLKDKWRNITKDSNRNSIQEYSKYEYNTDGGGDYHIKLFTKSGCGYCKLAKKLLDDNNLTYYETIITEKNRNQFINKLKINNIQATTYPFIFINNEFIGGYDKLKKKLKKI